MGFAPSDALSVGLTAPRPHPGKKKGATLADHPITITVRCAITIYPSAKGVNFYFPRPIKIVTAR